MSAAETRVVVVGGGVMGASIAYHLARRGADVTLLERAMLCAGPTRHSTAIVRLHYTQELLVQMAAHGLRVYRDFADEVGATAGFTQTGMLFGVAEDERALLEANVELGRRVGAETALVSSDEVRSLDPRVVSDGMAFCYEPEAGYCDPYLATSGYASAAREAGARTEERTRVERVDDGSVETTTGSLEADAIVVAAGPWSADLLGAVDFDLPVKPAPAEVGRYRLPDAFGSAPPAIADFSSAAVYYRPAAEPGFLEVGSLAPEHADEPVDPDHPVEGARAETLRAYEDAVTARLRGAAGGHWRGAWTGVYDVTPDWEPVIDRVPGTDHVYVAAGFSGHGFKLAPAVGLSIAELVLDGAATTFDLGLLSANRFARGELIGGRYGYSVLG
jgi:glycine/D-amino acid oxidase-like deaminating enzyme